MARKKTQPFYVSFLVVCSKGRYATSFPVDMLRYDDCRPLEERDSLSLSTDPGSSADLPEAVALERHARAPGAPTIARWESFCWRVEGVFETASEALQHRDFINASIRRGDVPVWLVQCGTCGNSYHQKSQIAPEVCGACASVGIRVYRSARKEA